MIKKTLKMIGKVLFEPIYMFIGKNVPLALCLLGVIVSIVGVFSAGSIERVLLNIGGAILGAGVFSVIMKSVLFIDVFQGHIFDVLYRPSAVINLNKLKEKWVELTEAMLKNTLPKPHRDATSSVLLKQFFDEELQYHFENLEATYDIEIQDDKLTAIVKHTIVADLVISPNHDNPIITQKIKIKEQGGGEGSCELLFLSINNKAINLSKNQYLNEDPNDPDLKIFTFPLNDFLKGRDPELDRVIKLERSYRFYQDLSKEPYLMATFSRYVRTCVVKAKVNGRQLIFKKSGIDSFSNIDESTDAHDYKRWTVAKKDQLLLPGQGYILMIV
jgi:hypothetical protein